MALVIRGRQVTNTTTFVLLGRTVVPLDDERVTDNVSRSFSVGPGRDCRHRDRPVAESVDETQGVSEKRREDTDRTAVLGDDTQSEQPRWGVVPVSNSNRP